MKTNQILRSLRAGSAVIAVLAVTACSSDQSKQQAAKDEHGHDPAVHAEAPAAVPVSLEDQKAQNVYQHYIHLKNALVSGDAKEAQSGAAALQAAFTEAGNANGADLAGKLASLAEVKAQRSEFEAITAEAEQVIRGSKVKSGTIYKQYCPMANNNEGAYWLSGEPEIRNPYFGDEMLECGEVKEQIK